LSGDLFLASLTRSPFPTRTARVCPLLEQAALTSDLTNVESTVGVARRKDSTLGSSRHEGLLGATPRRRLSSDNAAFDLRCLKNENVDLAILDALRLEVIRARRGAAGFQVPAAE
jgi:hypothetical protein